MQTHVNGKPKGDAEILDYQTLLELFKNNWVQQDTAVLVIHGIGNQNPLETLDGFSRGLVEAFQDAGYHLKLEHHLARKTASDDRTPWFDNYLRIRKEDESGANLDIYEYYWAHETEGQATFKDLNTWLNNVTKGARIFYAENVAIARENKDESIFIRNGKFRPFYYWLCVSFVPQLLVFFNWVIDGFYKFLASIPLIGPIVSIFAQGHLNGTLERLSNVLNDISIYNTTDAKSRFFKIRNCILNGAVDALRYLLEARTSGESETFHFQYGRVLLAGHSLGSQIAFDAINRLNHLVNQGEIRGYDTKGECNLEGENSGISVADRLIGLVTFGSPLDKIAFFFREQVSGSEYLRSQIISHFHGFKQRKWINLKGVEDGTIPAVIACEERLFEKVAWHNYWDNRDYISGSLDYYEGVKNIKCSFPSSWHSFTHSRYWACNAMYANIIYHFLIQNHEPVGGK